MTVRKWLNGVSKLSLALLVSSLVLVFALQLSASTYAVESPQWRPRSEDSLPRMHERDYAHLSDQSLSLIPSLLDPRPIIDHRQKGSLLSDILIPRIPGSSNNAKVRDRIVQPFKKDTKWTIEEHKFTAKTPDGDQEMTNIIITHNPGAPRKLMLACHHDSKITPTGFVGATDSAAPCAIMIDTALSLTEALDRRHESLKNGQGSGAQRSEEATLQLIFFDGEEAYRTWTHTDSIYGSK